MARHYVQQPAEPFLAADGAFATADPLPFGGKRPAISLPPGGKGFWEGGTLPEASQCPEIPRTPAAVLERVGDFPNWQGERKLNDLLVPVYEVASRYAQEYVFSRKPEPETRRG